MGGAASPSIVPRCTLWKVRCKLFLVKPARPAQSTAVPRYLLVQALSLLGINFKCLNFKVVQDLAFYSHTTFKAHLLGLLGQHISGPEAVILA